MEIKKGDLLCAKDVDVIVHQCNCFKKMGSGIAKSIKEKFPQAHNADENTEYASREKLGTYSFCIVNNGERDIKIINLYSQYYYGYGEQTEYDALWNGLNQLFCDIKEEKRIVRVGFPYVIGCGLAGGDIPTVLDILFELEIEHLPFIEIVLYKK